MADRILAGIGGAPRTSALRSSEAMAGEYKTGWGRESDDARAVNAELFDAQAALARARALVGLPQAAFVELPVEAAHYQALVEQGRQWTIADDVALVRSLRRDVRELFATLHGEEPELARIVAPLADEDTEFDDEPELDAEDWPASADPPERYVGMHTAVAGCASFGGAIGIVIAAGTGDILFVLLLLVMLPMAIYVLVTGLAVVGGKRSDPRRVVQMHAPIVSLFAIVSLLGAILAVAGGSPEAPKGRYAPGFLTGTVWHALRIHGLTSHPPRASLSTIGYAVVVGTAIVELALTLQILLR